MPSVDWRWTHWTRWSESAKNFAKVWDWDNSPACLCMQQYVCLVWLFPILAFCHHTSIYDSIFFSSWTHCILFKPLRRMPMITSATTMKKSLSKIMKRKQTLMSAVIEQRQSLDHMLIDSIPKYLPSPSYHSQFRACIYPYALPFLEDKHW